MLSCQLSIYPLASTDFSSIILSAIDHLKPFEQHGLTITVGEMSTVIKGPDHVVWDAVQTLFKKTEQSGYPIVMNTTFSNECGL